MSSTGRCSREGFVRLERPNNGSNRNVLDIVSRSDQAYVLRRFFECRFGSAFTELLLSSFGFLIAFNLRGNHVTSRVRDWLPQHHVKRLILLCRIPGHKKWLLGAARQCLSCDLRRSITAVLYLFATWGAFVSLLEVDQRLQSLVFQVLISCST